MRNNSSKTSLFLMELIIAILFFSLASAICIQLFVRSHIVSNESVELNYSVLWAQNTAELFYGCNGDAGQMASLLENEKQTSALLENDDAQNHGAKQTLTLFFDRDFHSLNADQLLAASCDPAVYRLKADISKDSDLMTCNITVENLENTQEISPIYTLEVTLFPDKEVSYEP